MYPKESASEQQTMMPARLADVTHVGIHGCHMALFSDQTHKHSVIKRSISFRAVPIALVATICHVHPFDSLFTSKGYSWFVRVWRCWSMLRGLLILSWTAGGANAGLPRGQRAAVTSCTTCDNSPVQLLSTPSELPARLRLCLNTRLM
jgi:hypothetical protein